MKKFLINWFLDEENPKKYLLDVFIALMILLSIVLIFFQNEEGYLSKQLEYLDTAVLFFFIVEYIIRFYICSDFKRDYLAKGLGFAIKRKLSWMARPSSMIDLLAILPSLTFFRAFRTLRFLRFLRLIRLIKAFKTFREIDKLNIILQGMKEHNRLFSIFFVTTFFILLVLSFGLYSVEHQAKDGDFSTFPNSFWYSLELIELADTTPKTIFGKLLSVLLLIFNMAIFGFFISIILNKITQVMNAITSGKITRLNIKNHIVICGYSKSSEKVIEYLLKDRKHCNKIVLVTQKPVLDRDVDLRTVMTIFHIEKEAPHIHTIAEINDEMNAEIIKDKIKGDEILFKEVIDAKLITTCIGNPNISPMFYQLFGEEEVRVKSAKFSDFNFPNPTIIKEVRLSFLEQGKTLLGVIDEENESILSPLNDMLVDESYRLVYFS